MQLREYQNNLHAKSIEQGALVAFDGSVLLRIEQIDGSPTKCHFVDIQDGSLQFLDENDQVIQIDTARAELRYTYI